MKLSTEIIGVTSWYGVTVLHWEGIVDIWLKVGVVEEVEVVEEVDIKEVELEVVETDDWSFWYN